MTCTVEACERPHHSRGLCGTHYARLQRTGTTADRVHVPPPCEVDGCEARVYSNGWCATHYQRWRHTGTTDPRPAVDFAERFWANVTKTAACWLWNGRPAKTGYGRVSRNNVIEYAHRVAHELAIGPIPDGLSIDHLCRVRMCVNPAHLEAVTLAENTRREMAARKEAS